MFGGSNICKSNVAKLVSDKVVKIWQEVLLCRKITIYRTVLSLDATQHILLFDFKTSSINILSLN